ncbi:hypothetical protein SEA_KABOCHA_3 [Gordonia phage Kabocha]|uniref:Uncharacterized protein n=1 Tax=Gordonia phage Chidiebere TaxID=2656530 RepID=A0A649VL81_9CAUD|nr:hypothetical protein PQD14_gp003 [Gordonia phage Chidiebere]AZS07858.1 hypothetical protein PBI_GRAY_3 [Gordonia phage Gray]WAA19790.1 hypothetical protein SEA_KABOCHA_3 [Gordonia phage Kabocha]WAA19981.1 hypothetical protein SEA_HANEM_3 [Gordonia phage Hanem]WNM67024.1 hypothetical protein SEA_SCHOMBER_3 [Gordonia Phage Schomber]QGJ92895.1 hypothetical protein PBI_CHIDIEBERE_3 [Gordonia phage Chidiebere]
MTADHRVYAEHIGGDAKLLCRGNLRDCRTYIESMNARIKKKELKPLGAGWSVKIAAIVEEGAMHTEYPYEVAGTPLVRQEDAERMTAVMAAIDLNHPLVAAIAHEKAIGKVRALRRVREDIIKLMAGGVKTIDEAVTQMYSGDNGDHSIWDDV